MEGSVIIYRYNNKFVFSEIVDGRYNDMYINAMGLDLMGTLVYILGEYNLRIERKNIFVIDQPLISISERYVIADLLFDHFNVNAIYFESQSLLALYDNDLTTGILIDTYKNKLLTIPICNETILYKNISTIDITKLTTTVIDIHKTNKTNLEENIILATTINKTILDMFDNFDGNFLLGDALSGAKKIIHLIPWICKEKYKKNSNIILDYDYVQCDD